MRYYLIGGLVLLFYVDAAQAKRKHLPSTAEYAGVYAYGKNPDKAAAGMITVYPETDSTILFYLDVCKGPSSYNLGQLYSRLKVKDGKGEFYITYDSLGQDCRWKVTIQNKILTITTVDYAYDCGFGNGVGADGMYKQKTKKIPEYFIDGHNTKVFFSKTSPEAYKP